MGRNLALNLIDHGTHVTGWDRDPALVERFIGEASDGVAASGFEDLVDRLEAPRVVMLMVPAGQAVDDVLAELAPRLGPGDVVIDGGNTYFEDTRRRASFLAERSIEFVGMGVSGGEAGARHGPSMMVGASERAWTEIEDIFLPIAAIGSDRCVARLGTDGAGHFVKMVHNGIEYADMQFIAEVYDVLRTQGLAAPAIADVFEGFNAGPLESYLVELTAQVLRCEDPITGGFLVDVILDAAEQKGTGRWTVQTAIALGVPVPSISAAVDARSLSSDVARRKRLAAGFPGKRDRPDVDVETLAQALLAAKIAAYVQGQQLIVAGNEAFGWSIEPATVVSIWTGGCIIRAALLHDLSGVTEDDWLAAEALRQPLQTGMSALSEIVARAHRARVPVPALGASLSWFDASRSTQLPQNLTQAQRDAFGAHTFRRIDAPDEPVHHEW